jgi:hypothetical protein
MIMRTNPVSFEGFVLKVMRSLLSPVWQRRQKLFSQIAFYVLLTLLPFTQVDAEDTGSFKNSPIYQALHPHTSFDTQIVSIPFGDTSYDIPRNYLVGVTQPTAANSYAAFMIMVLLPDMTPRTPQNREQFEVLGWHNQLRALFEFGRQATPPQEIIDRTLSWQKRDKDSFVTLPSGLHAYLGLLSGHEDLYVKSGES